MDFHIDTADISEVKAANSLGILDGVTTNPTLVAKTGRPNKEVIADICKEVDGLVSAEVISLEADKMYAEGMELAKLADNVVVKIPMCVEGLKAVKRFSAEGIKTNVTLVFSPLQALLVAKAGATLCSPFVGRLDDISNDGMGLIANIKQIYDNYGFTTKVLVASIRHPMHIMDAALIGADIVTVPLKVINQLAVHPLTDKGIAQFLKDAEKVPQ
ncbi:MAG: fructose-6-phosphate aldolase [Bdellovibrionaceae bacterium]|nr:fructose-6-phosphate aldolase [Pseudobdellovibrionaceae bacterium]|tara:strand:- start:283 stop:927 length:645 start_codon:yes stop_codon:yes gene_type:complete